jgi:hypothetical protein
VNGPGVPSVLKVSTSSPPLPNFDGTQCVAETGTGTRIGALGKQRLDVAPKGLWRCIHRGLSWLISRSVGQMPSHAADVGEAGQRLFHGSSRSTLKLHCCTYGPDRLGGDGGDVDEGRPGHRRWSAPSTGGIGIGSCSSTIGRRALQRAGVGLVGGAVLEEDAVAAAQPPSCPPPVGSHAKPRLAEAGLKRWPDMQPEGRPPVPHRTMPLRMRGNRGRSLRIALTDQDRRAAGGVQAARRRGA